jgi:hypothetical protein
MLAASSSAIDRTEQLGHADEFRCDDCGRPLDQCGSRCVDCAADRRADRAYERSQDR